MTVTRAIKRAVFAIGVVGAMLGAPGSSPSAQQPPLRIAIRLKDLELGQLLVATGMTQVGTLTCHGVTLNAPRVFLISGRDGDDANQLMYFEQGTGAGAKWDLGKLVNEEACPGPQGVNYYLYEIGQGGR